MMRKGITPIIAIIILLLITIALAGAAWTFLSGFLGMQIEKSFFATPGGTYCTYDSTNDSYNITVTVANTGTSTIKASDFIVAAIDDSDVTIDPTLEIKIREGKVAIRSNNNTAGETWSGQGNHVVYIGTTASVQQIPVTCP